MQKSSTQAQYDLERLLNKLIPRYQPLRVILFGSYAYGAPTTDSDLDLLIVKQTDQPPFQRRVEVGRIVQDKERRTPIQPLVITPGELQHQLERQNPFFP